MAELRSQKQTEDPQDQSMEEILQSIRRIIAEEGDAPAEGVVAANDGISDILELTDIVEDDDHGDILKSIDTALDVQVPSEPEPEIAAPAVAIPEAPQFEHVSPPQEAVTFEAPQPEPVAEPVAHVHPQEDHLITPDAVHASASAFQNLVHAVAKPDPLDVSPRTRGGTSLEELTIEAMRPMLKEWLDDNLPGLVQKIVEKEVRRITRDLSNPDD